MEPLLVDGCLTADTKNGILRNYSFVSDYSNHRCHRLNGFFRLLGGISEGIIQIWLRRAKGSQSLAGLSHPLNQKKSV